MPLHGLAEEHGSAAFQIELEHRLSGLIDVDLTYQELFLF
jgi:hypothetical protein